MSFRGIYMWICRWVGHRMTWTTKITWSLVGRRIRIVTAAVLARITARERRWIRLGITSRWDASIILWMWCVRRLTTIHIRGRIFHLCPSQAGIGSTFHDVMRHKNRLYELWQSRILVVRVYALNHALSFIKWPGWTRANGFVDRLKGQGLGL